MNIESLKCFILVAENLNFARAAEAMYKTQPAVTKQIYALEEELGVSLFTRSTRHVELTPAGMSFYKDAKDIVLSSQMAVEKAKKQSVSENTLRIGLSNTTALFYLSPILSKLHKEHPDIRPSIQVLNYKTILSLFAENKLDVLFYYKENMTKTAGTSFQELRKDCYVCLMPPTHRFAQKEVIIMDELKEEPIIICNPLNAPLSTAFIQQKLLEHHSAQNILYCDSIEIAHCMVSAGMGISVLPGILCLKAPDYMTVPLDDKTRLSYGVFYRKQNINPSLRQLLKFI